MDSPQLDLEKRNYMYQNFLSDGLRYNKKHKKSPANAGRSNFFELADNY